LTIPTARLCLASGLRIVMCLPFETPDFIEAFSSLVVSLRASIEYPCETGAERALGTLPASLSVKIGA